MTTMKQADYSAIQCGAGRGPKGRCPNRATRIWHTKSGDLRRCEDHAQDPETPSTRIIDGPRCEATMTVVRAVARCELAVGHDGFHEYVSAAGGHVQFGQMETGRSTIRMLQVNSDG